MKDMREFAAPRGGETVVCEIDGVPQHAPFAQASASIFTASINDHPKVHIARESLQPPGLLAEEQRPIFLATDVPFPKRLSQTYLERGLIAAVSLCLSALPLWRALVAAKRRLFKGAPRGGAALLAELSQTRDWAGHSVRCVAWHPYANRIAVATCDDTVRIYSGHSNFIALLRCKQQKSVTCVAWRPMSLTEIVVGHENGAAVWNIDFGLMVSRPSVSNTIMLHRPGHTPVISVAWSSRGDILVTASPADPLVVAWDVELRSESCLRSSRELGNVLLKWSPTGNKLLSVSNGIIFRIWDCNSWRSDRWTTFPGRVSAACWSNCGTSLLFATNTGPTIYGLSVNSDTIFASTSHATVTDHAFPLYDLSKLEMDGTTVGGMVQSLETDPHGKHLAVLFRDTNCVALFTVVRVPKLQILPRCLINGLPAEVPSTMAFQQDFKYGACLTIGWSSGRLQHFPIIYSDLTNP